MGNSCNLDRGIHFSTAERYYTRTRASCSMTGLILSELEGRIRLKEYQYVQDVLTDFQNGKGHLSGFYKTFQGGNWVRKFEEAFANYIGVNHAIAVSSGTAALHTAVEALHQPHELGFPALVTPYSFVASASSIVMGGGFPMFCDIEPSTLNLDASAYKPEGSFGKHWRPRLIVAVHLLGHPSDLDQIEKRFPNVPIIEDCAQSLGAKYKGKMTGSLGTISCFSFQETKSLTTLGEGGMICTNNPSLAEECMAIRNHGEKYVRSNRLGYNYRMTEAAAAFGLAQLERLDKTVEQQIRCAQIVRDNLPEGLKPLTTKQWASPTYFIAGSLMDSAYTQSERASYLKRAASALSFDSPLPGKTIGPGYTELICDLPYFKNRGASTDFPIARTIMSRAVWFDIHRFCTVEEVKERMEKLKEVRLVRA